jgi:hypothetical protein
MLSCIHRRSRRATDEFNLVYLKQVNALKK